MARIGYARVSSIGQSLDVQIDKLSDCDELFKETRSGTTYARPELQACIRFIRKGDVLVVTKLDRLARSTLHLCQIADELNRKEVRLEVIDQKIDTGTATGKLLFNMLGAIAEFENGIRSERQMDGIAKAKERGVRLGRQKTLTDDQVDDLRARRASGVLIRDLMKETGLSKASVYRYLGNQESSS